jgi:phosphoribosylaminoimidazole carboxylase PurE protein
MGSQSDWATMKHAADTLDALGIGHVAKIISAHRTPERHLAFCKGAKAKGFKIIIAGAGGAAHLPGVTAALTPLPVFGVPIDSKLSGVDSLYSIAQMPAGIPVGTLAIGGRARSTRRCLPPACSRSAMTNWRPGSMPGASARAIRFPTPPSTASRNRTKSSHVCATIAASRQQISRRCNLSRLREAEL